MNIIDGLNAISEQRKKVNEEAVAAAKALLKPGFELFFNEHPDVKAVGWSQYTPYFNDGEECVFSLHGMYASATDEREESFYDEGWTEVYGDPEDGFTKESWDALSKLEEALNDAEDVLRDAFGDHVAVYVTRDGIDVEEYEHD